jgi:hypothetical protein
MLQQSKETAASEGAEDINDSRQYCERRTYPKAEKRHCNYVKVLEREDENRGDEHNDNGKIDPAHVASFVRS